MAIKDHSLDNLIIKAAKEEFLEKGFLKASLRTIAKKAGITTGAFYTRYKNKDDLFESLIKEPFEDLKIDYKEVEKYYIEVKQTKNVDSFLKAIKYEEKIFLDILFKHYDECVLLMCKSEGSNLNNKMKAMIDIKVNQTICFFKSIASKEYDFDAIILIMKEQFNYYKEILEQGYSKEKAVLVMRNVEEFLEAGWKKVFEKII